MSRFLACLLTGFCLALLPADACAQVSAKQILAYTPKQPGVDFETPSAAEAAQCRVEVVKVGRGSGYALYGPASQILRRFEDSDGDQKLDRYRYYSLGLEVYRDIDTNADEKIDEFRWLNTNGTRWGRDTNGDMKIDVWKRMSAEEASREAVNAIVAADPRAMKALLLTEADVRAIGLSPDVASAMLGLARDVTGDMQRTARAGGIGKGTVWERFDSSMLTPQLVPAESNKTSRDVLVYENVLAIIKTTGNTSFLQIGEVVKVGDVWKLTQVPKTIDGNDGVIAGGILMQPDVGPTGPVDGALPPAMQKLIDQLTALDQAVPSATATDQEKIKYNRARADLLGRLADASTNPEDANNWRRQQVEVVTAAFQGNAYPGGIEELQRLETTAAPALKPFVVYRRLLAEYTDRLMKAGETERAAQQDWLLGQLQSYLQAYPKSDDAPEAMWQLGSALELSEKTTEAKKWYSEAVRNFRGSPASELAEGALRRLNLKGQPFAVSGPKVGGGTANISKYRGKVTAVIYWATWNSDFTAGLPDLKKLYTKYRSDGFEVLAVNADGPDAPIEAYVRQQGIPWETISEKQGLEGTATRQYGIFVLPHIILVDRKGVVVDPSASLTDLQTIVPRLLLER